MMPVTYCFDRGSQSSETENDPSVQHITRYNGCILNNKTYLLNILNGTKQFEIRQRRFDTSFKNKIVFIVDARNRAALNYAVEADIGAPVGPFTAKELWKFTNDGQALGTMTTKDCKNIFKSGGRFHVYPLQNAKISDIVWRDHSANQPGFLPHRIKKKGKTQSTLRFYRPRAG